MAAWMQEFVQAGAIWIHSGIAAQPHALLTSGLHSDGFVNCTYVTQRPALLRGILTAHDGLQRHLPTGRDKPDWVVGSAMGAITFAYAVAEQIGARAAFTEKDGEAMKLSRFDLEAGAQVLIVEDVLSTGGSTLKTIEGVRAATSDRAQFLPFILCLVNRSGSGELGPYRIRALLEPEIHNWNPQECPLCRQGSKAVRPKAHWKELTGR